MKALISSATGGLGSKLVKLGHLLEQGRTHNEYKDGFAEVGKKFAYKFVAEPPEGFDEWRPLWWASTRFAHLFYSLL